VPKYHADMDLAFDVAANDTANIMLTSVQPNHSASTSELGDNTISSSILGAAKDLDSAALEVLDFDNILRYKGV
jgi:hypothetical protein